jgi:ribonuclease J
MTHPHPDLGAPDKLVAGGLRIVALGGLAEIGRNMTVFETNGKLLIVDCGVLFPEENQPGIDLILPDFSYIRDRLDDVVGLVLTHGHEDHIGATPYLLRERGDIALYGSALTLALVSAKLKEHRISPLTREVKEGMREDIGPFEVEFIAVTLRLELFYIRVTSRWINCRWMGASPICVPLLAWVMKVLIYS